MPFRAIFLEKRTHFSARNLAPENAGTRVPAYNGGHLSDLLSMFVSAQMARCQRAEALPWHSV